ncbi:MAG: pyridoxamine 5'-phosphate oxidase [Nocardioidaceae bacterium]
MNADRLARLRAEYADAGLDESVAGDDPIELFARWLDEAVASGLHEPNAMALATAGRDGAPTVRFVLLKGFDRRGFCFYTNYDSRKSAELAAEPRCGLVFAWHPMGRQVRVDGVASRLSASESDAYFALRPRESQLGAWASPQSRIVADRAELDRAYAAVGSRFASVDPIPRPPHWGGWRVAPTAVEFWQGRTGRMHDRLRFAWADGGWTRSRLAP